MPVFPADQAWLRSASLSDVVNLQVHRVLADLTASGEEPVDQLVAPGAGQDRPLVGEDSCA